MGSSRGLNSACEYFYYALHLLFRGSFSFAVACGCHILPRRLKLDSSVLMSIQLTCVDCTRIFKLTRTLAQHRKSCAWVKQRQREAARVNPIDDNRMQESETLENSPSGFEAAHGVITEAREQSGNAVYPYPTLLDAVVGLVSPEVCSGSVIGSTTSLVDDCGRKCWETRRRTLGVCHAQRIAWNIWPDHVEGLERASENHA